MGVREYSTLGGTTGYAFRSISLSRSISRSVWVSIFFEHPGRLRARTPVRHVPPLKCSEWSTIVVHLTLNSSSTRRCAQSSSSMIGLYFGIVMVPKW